MTSRRISRQDLLSGCDQPGPGDGQDPRFDSRPGSRKVANRKALQLCGEVARTLSSILAGECADAILRDLLVVSVVPAPNSSRLLVTVSRSDGPPPEDEVPILLAHLERARGLLRTEMASALHRRRVPDLTFHVLHPTER